MTPEEWEYEGSCEGCGSTMEWLGNDSPETPEEAVCNNCELDAARHRIEELETCEAELEAVVTAARDVVTEAPPTGNSIVLERRCGDLEEALYVLDAKRGRK